MRNNIIRKTCYQSETTIVLCLLLLMILSAPATALELDAELDWAKQVDLGTPVGGVVKHVFTKPGEKVTKGQVLLQLDQRSFNYRISGLKAELHHFKSELAEARREQERALELYDRTVLSDHELQVAKNKYVEAKANYDKGKADLAQAKLDLEFSELRAPFDALIISRYAEVGQIVVTDLKPVILFKVADARNMYAKTRVTSKQLSEITINMEAKIVINDLTYNGRVTSVVQELSADKKSADRKFIVSVEFPVKQQRLYAGQAATIILP